MAYAVVCGGANVDIGARPYAPLRAKDSNPGRVWTTPGGVGRNIAHDLRLLGVTVELLTALGGDGYARQLEASCAALGIGTSHALHAPDAATSVYLYINDFDGDMALAVSDMDICARLTPTYFEAQQALLDGAGVVVADANLPEASLRYLAERCRAPLFVDPVSTVKAEKLRGVLPLIHTLKPNRAEAELLSGVAVTDEKSARCAAERLLDLGVTRVFLSLGSEGVLAAEAGNILLQPAYPTSVRSTTGAGDSFAAALAWAWLRGESLSRSAALACAAASIVSASGEASPASLTAERCLALAR